MACMQEEEVIRKTSQNHYFIGKEIYQSNEDSFKPYRKEDYNVLNKMS